MLGTARANRARRTYRLVRQETDCHLREELTRGHTRGCALLLSALILASLLHIVSIALDPPPQDSCR